MRSREIVRDKGEIWGDMLRHREILGESRSAKTTTKIKARVARAPQGSRPQARRIMLCLARALRALAGGLSLERFAHAPCVEILARVTDSV